MSKEELEDIALESTRTIEIDEFDLGVVLQQDAHIALRRTLGEVR